MDERQSRIQLEDVWLRFQLYANKSFSLREMILNPIKSAARAAEIQCDTFDALKGISLTISHGDRVALIGPNGAGKSSLLKVIAGIYPFTSGTMTISGRVTPLIEMGAGFHLELTGRENIYLNAAILGASRAEVDAKMSNIIEFSEIPLHFFDIGVKYYSSGMITRLGFSVAMELRPEILILDEIFAAADAHFIEKASRRLREFIAAAHILLLVTHDLKLAQSLSNRGIWIEGGKVCGDGPTADVIAKYIAADPSRAATPA
jgi:ABC-type polysaccharide/polyol phosphate transport system ATPase subunit